MEVLFSVSVILCTAIFLAACTKWKKYQRESRIIRYRNRQSRRIQQDKILIAIEPINIFVDISNTRKERFIQLEIQRNGIDKFVYYFKKLFGVGAIYYKIKDKKNNNAAFIESLLHTKRVELFLYTALQEEFADILLKKLDLTKYFTEDRRRYCHGTSQELKHPTQIDSKIKRVIIITGSKYDHLEEDSEYFLVLKKKDKKLYGKALADLITQIDSIDELHQQFVHWKIDIESDHDSSQEKIQ